VITESTKPHAQNELRNTTPPFRLPFAKRLLRALPVIGALAILTLIFGHLGILHMLETVVTDTEMRLNASPKDSAVAIVDIDDEDYRKTLRKYKST
jgi:CHASE2 domain-containing sensor protein